jgi:hypothetical protein
VNLSAEYALAFDEAHRAIDKQADELEQVRGRIGTLFSVAAVVGALPIDAILKRADELGGYGLGALSVAGVGLTIIAAAVVKIWWPAETTFKLDPGVIVGSFIEAAPPHDIDAIRRELALHVSRHVRANRPRIDERMRWFALASVAFLVEVIALLMTAVDLI